MEARLDLRHAPTRALKAMLGLEAYLSGCGLARGLLDLGESEQRLYLRLYLLNAWREAPFYTEREQAALAWTEAVTRVTEGHVPDPVYEQARTQFSADELANLTLAVVADQFMESLERRIPNGGGKLPTVDRGEIGDREEVKLQPLQ
jgi:hypothetical protein